MTETRYSRYHAGSDPPRTRVARRAKAEGIHYGDRAGSHGEDIPQDATHSGRGTLLKIYLRNARDAGFVASYLRERLPQAQLLILGADICRRELLVEIDAVHLGAGT